jgi:diphosphomevalonate decarboxylase
MRYSQQYTRETAQLLPIPSVSDGTVAWESPSNIALVKYWGKKEFQFPLNPSVSFTLSKAVTQTQIAYAFKPDQHELKLSFRLHDEQKSDFEERLKQYLEKVIIYLPFLNKLSLEIKSENSFPHSTGIASSASAFSSIALCLLDIENSFLHQNRSEENFFKKASFLSRIGSGSAARSIYEGVVLWGVTHGIANSSNEIAIEINDRIHSRFKNFYDVILLVDYKPKKITSSKGHSLMNDNPYAEVRFGEARKNACNVIKALEIGDLHHFLELVEYEALSLHAMMMTSYPGYFLMNPATLTIIEKIRQFRLNSGVPVGFTLDAGANVHALFPSDAYNRVMEFIHSDIKHYCLEQKFIIDHTGSGPKRICAK